MKLLKLNTTDLRKKKNFFIALGVFLTCSLIFFTVAQYKNSQKQLLVQQYQIHSLIAELGEIREQQDAFAQTLDMNFQQQEQLLSDLKIKNELQKSEYEKLKVMHMSAQEELQQVMEQKEANITDLVMKNQKLNEQMGLKKDQEKVMGVLLIGHNRGLTDTIILALIDSEKQKVVFVNIPRDFSYNGRKINEYYKLYGIERLEDAVLKVTGFSVDHYVVINFQALVDMVNAVGGIDIDIPKALVDYNYPTKNLGYQTVSFQKGLQHMDGEMALKYARSRKSTSDFDRGLRQQEILKALKEKIITSDLLQKMDVLGEIFAQLSTNIDTDISFFKALDLFQMVKDYHLDTGHILSTSNYLYSTKNAKGQYILLPLDKSYTKIQEFVLGLLND